MNKSKNYKKSGPIVFLALAKKGLRKKKTEGFLSGTGMVVFMQCDSYFAYDICT